MTLQVTSSGPTRQEAPANIGFITPHGEPDTLAHYAGPLLVVQLVRYFGCLPCQRYLEDLDGRAPELQALGARAVAIGGSADYQARWLLERGVKMPLLLDPEQRFREWAGMGDLSPRQAMSLTGMRNYVGAILAGYGLQRPTQDRQKSPGVVVLSGSLDLVWSYEGTALGDYPPVDALIATVAELSASVGERPDASKVESRPDGSPRPPEG